MHLVPERSAAEVVACKYVHVPGTVLWQLGNVLWQLGKDEKGGTLAGRQGGKGVERVLLACCLKGVGFWIAPLLACFFGGVVEGGPPQSHFAC